MPAKAVTEVSEDCAMARDVTESSSRDNSISTTSDTSSRRDVLSNV